MEKKTIFALTMAFVMGALAVTPAFAQDKGAKKVMNDTLPYIQPLDTYIEPYRHETHHAGRMVLPADTTNQIRRALTEAEKEQLANYKKQPMMDHISIQKNMMGMALLSFWASQSQRTKFLNKNIKNNKKFDSTQIAAALLMAQTFATLNLPINLTKAALFTTAYANAGDKDQFLMDMFHNYVYIGSEEEENNPLVKAIIEQDVEAFRNNYEATEDKLKAMEHVLSLFTYETPETETDAETDAE